MKDLQSAFAARDSAYFNRSSAVFPVRLRPGANLILSFLNYFKFKNNVISIVANIRIYGTDGTLDFFSSYRITDNTYAYSIRSLIGRDIFDGAVEIEFISIDNLRIPFPAVLGFYTAGDHYSAVHSAGRIKASSEAYTPFESEETNFTCKFDARGGKTLIGPFIHVFNGPAKRTRDYKLRIRNKHGIVIGSKNLSYDFAPFASKIIEITNEFDAGQFEQEFFCSITASNDDIFPRFVCGNIHYDSNFLEVTHSYPLIQKPDFCAATEEKPLASFLPMLNHPQLVLDSIIFPTNIAATITGRVLSQRFDAAKLMDTGNTMQLNVGVGGGESILCPDGVAFMLVAFDHASGSIPSRINASYRYSVKGSSSPFSTDIATGAKANVYPQKFTHWGAGLISKEYHPVMMIRNNGHNPAKTQDAHFMLTIYLGDTTFNHAFSITAESATQINLKDIIPSTAYGAHVSIIHWLLKSDQPVGETFWVSYTDDGRICGEHGF